MNVSENEYLSNLITLTSALLASGHYTVPPNFEGEDDECAPYVVSGWDLNGRQREKAALDAQEIYETLLYFAEKERRGDVKMEAEEIWARETEVEANRKKLKERLEAETTKRLQIA